MSFEYWLPADALRGPAAKALVSKPVADWSTAWLRGVQAVVASASSDDDRMLPPGGVEKHGLRARLALSAAGKCRLLTAVLGADPSQVPATERDNRLLDAFVAEVLQDLTNRLDAMLAGEAQGPQERRTRFTVAANGDEILDVTVPDSLLIPLLKARLGGARSSRRPLCSRAQALRTMPVSAHASLGYANLLLSEIEELGVGDVVILDRALDDPVELRLASAGSAIARGLLCRNGDQVSIQL